VALAAAASMAAVAACAELTPTAIGDELLPGAPVTVEIELPWEAFGSNLQVLGGYGLPSDIGTGVLANAYRDTLNARTLVRFGVFPTAASVRDTAGTTVTDTNLTVLGGRLVAFLNRTSSTATTPVTIALGATQEPWHLASAGWANAVDTIGGVLPWSVSGGGTVIPIDTAVWTPSAGDSVAFMLDSAEVAAWSNHANLSRGGRLDLVTEGHRLDVRSVVLRLVVRPSVNPDTIIDLDVAERQTTFIYDPMPVAPGAGWGGGGAPGWRTVMDLQVPTQLNGPPALCAAVGCPVTLERGGVTYAALVLRSTQSEGPFQPTDSLGIDARQVLSRAALPKAPLGSTLLESGGRRIPGALFGSGVGSVVEIPITPFVRNLVEAANVGATGYSNTLALLSVFEPLSMTYGSFYGPGTPHAPVLKLIVTVGPSVELP